MSTSVKVDKYPPCDLGKLPKQTPCRDNGEAHYDGKTIFGGWANMCEHHFDKYGVGLGTGRGQKLMLS